MRVETMILIACLAVCAVPFGVAEPPAGAAKAEQASKTDQVDRTKMVEIKGDLARIHGDQVKALTYYLQALKNDPQNPLLYDKVGVAELKTGNHGGARKYFKMAIKIDPRYANGYNNLGALACIDKNYHTAVGYLKQALALDELSAPTHINMAEAWTGVGQMDHAMNEYARALELDGDVLTDNQNGLVAQISTPEQRARINYLIAKAYARRGNMEGALEFLRRAKDGNYPDLHNVYSDTDFTPLWNNPKLAQIVKR